jgi:hypothetical protein
MSELTVKRWRRYGKDRLYVNTAQGARVGWVDLVSGETVVEIEALREDFTRAIQAHRPGSYHPPDPSALATPPPEPPYKALLAHMIQHLARKPIRL